jgi:hypothetical protein
MRWTKGKYAFFVATHTDRQHIHNHIYYNSTSLDYTRKFRDFIGSARAVRKLSDRVCLENHLSVIVNPKLHSKGPAYERWAKVYNLKQMAAALMFLQEHRLTEYDQLAAQADGAAQRFHALAGELRQTEADLSKTSALMEAVVQYAKSRPVFDGYKAAKYSKKFLAQHEAELADYRAAKATLNDLLDGARLPRMSELKEKRRTLAAQKKVLYADYRATQQRMREAVAVKTKIDHLLGLTDQRKNKEQER